MKKKELTKRYIFFIISLFFQGVGIAFTKHGGLGVTPISSVANVANSRWPALSMGTWLIIWNCILIVGQIVILRKDFRPIQLLQVPVSVLFGWCTDIGILIASFVPTPNYVSRILVVLLGILILSFGIVQAVIANVIMNSGEAIVKAIADKTHLVFGNVKIGFDISCVILAVIFSLIVFQGQIVGTREGTVIIALLTGVVVKFYQKHLSVPIEKLLKA